MANKIMAVLLGVAMIIFLVIGPIMLVSFSSSVYQPFYSESFKTNAADQEFLTYLVLDYIRGIDVNLAPFSPANVSHLNDVKMLIRTAELLLIVSAILLVSLIPYIWWYKKNYKLVIKPVFIGSIISLGFMLLLAAVAWVGFEQIFRFFHNILFPQGGWEFVDTDLLILLFPIELFKTLTSRIIVSSVGLSAVMLFLSFLVLYKLNKK